MALSRALPGDKIPDGGRGFPGALKKPGGYSVALTAVAFVASGNHISSLICASLRYGDDVIHSIGFLTAVVTGVVIAL